jgi:hypothetical protein
MISNGDQAMSNGYSGSGHERCGGRTRSGGLCRLPAGWGTPTPGIGHCRKHLGNTPNHRAHADRVLVERAEATALAELHRIGVEPVGNPLEALVELAAEARQLKTILRRQVAALESVSQTTPAGIEQVRAVVILFERSMDRAAAFAAMCARLDIDSRLARISETIASQMVRVFEASLREMNLTPEQWETARLVFPRHLAALTDDGA